MSGFAQSETPARRPVAEPVGARAADAPPRPFILLNIPKTGSRYAAAFIRNADLLSLTRRPGMRRMLQRSPRIVSALSEIMDRGRRLGLLRSGRMNPRPHHEFYCRLPAALRSLPAVSALREPLSWHISRYIHVTSGEGGGYLGIYRLLQLLDRILCAPDSPRREAAAFFLERHLGGELSAAAWHNLSLEGYYYFTRRFYRSVIASQHFSVALPEDHPCGALSCRALAFLHREPQKLFSMQAEEAEEYFAGGRWRLDLCDVRLLKHERLREDLRSVMLERLGYRKEALDAALEITPVRIEPSPPKNKERAQEELRQKPHLREKILADERIYVQHLLPLTESRPRNGDDSPPGTNGTPP